MTRNNQAIGWQSNAPIAQLIAGEVPWWNSGLCRIEARREAPDGTIGKPVPGGMRELPDYIRVVGEGGHPIEVIDLNKPSLMAWDVDERVAAAIRQEKEAL